MDAEIEKFLNQYVDKALAGPGFIIYAPKEKEVFKAKIVEYLSGLIFETLLEKLTDEQLAELQELDLASDEAQQEIALMSASVPGFVFILQDRFDKAAKEIGRTGKIPEALESPEEKSS